MNIVDDIYTNLVANNILGGTDGWSLYKGTFYEEELAAAIIDTGEGKLPYDATQLIRYPTFQILLSSASYNTAFTKADEVYAYILKTISINSYVNFTPRGGIIPLGVNKSNLYLFSINFDGLNVT